MKIFIVLSTVFVLHSTASIYSQTTRISLNYEQARLGDLLSQIEKDTEFVFFYHHGDVDQNIKIDIHAKDRNIHDVLTVMFRGTGIEWTIRDRLIILGKKASGVAAVFQTLPVTGVITDSNGDPLPGASIVIKGTTQGTVTDINGKFSISVPDEHTTLVFSFVGYVTQEFLVGNRRIINVTMSEDSRQIEEVVVIGYGTARRADLTGSVSSVTATQLKDIPVTSAAAAITGKMPGVHVTQTEGSPDAEIKIRVRGGGSITQDNSPLYIIDGFPVDNMNAIAPTDIASIDVLKDASSTAIYGARGANGVIIITTKSGYEGKATVSYNMYYGQKKVTKYLDVLDPYEYVWWQYELLGPGNTFERGYGRPTDIRLYKNVDGKNWQKEVFGRSGSTLYNNLSITGGAKATRYNISMTRNDEEEIMMGSGLARTNFAAKTTHVINDWLSAEMNLRLSDLTIKGAGTSGTAIAGRLPHIVQFRPTNGLLDVLDDEIDPADWENISQHNVNPFQQTNDDYRRGNTQTYNYNGALNIKFLTNFTYRFAFGMQYIKNTNKRFYGLGTSQSMGNGFQPLADIRKDDTRSWQIAQTVTFSKRNFIPGHNINVLAGQEMTYRSSESLTASVMLLPKYIDPEGAFAMMNLGSAYPISTFAGAPTKLSSFFGRASWDYKGRYLFNATLRADGSSKFAPGYQWGFFPSAGAAWRISDESFMSVTKTWLNDLKLRASYGHAGNNRINDDMWRQSFNTSSGRLFMDGSLANPSSELIPNTTLNNPVLKWETTITRNIGLDFSLLKYRLTGSVELYQNTTKDLLISATIPSHTGYTAQMQNIGQTSNRGIEISLNGVMVDAQDFKLSGSFNIGINKNKIDRLGETKRWTQTVNWSGVANADYLIEEGGKTGLMYGYETDGNGMYSFDDFTYDESIINTANRYIINPGVANNSGVTGARNFRPGALKFVKQNVPDDPEEVDALEASWWVINSDDDKIIIGDANPKHTGGFSITATYKGFDFSAFFNWVYGNSIYNANKLNFTTFPNSRYYRNLLGMMDSKNRFTHYDPVTTAYVYDPDELQALNQDAKYWSCSMTLPVLHSWAIEDGSFLRLNNVTIGYSLPKSVLAKLRIQQLRVYVTGYNLWIWTNYSGFDPEVDMIRSTPLTPGIDYNAYPKARTCNVGINLTF